LYFGGRVSKDHPRVEACGSLDELCSFLGSAKSIVKGKNIKKAIESIQKDLSSAASEIATEPPHIRNLKNRIDKTRVNRIEKMIEDYEAGKVSKGRCFYIPGKNRTSASLDVARAVCRRAERVIVASRKKGLLKNDFILIYLNRLSDLLYLMERSCDKKIK